MKQIIKLEFYEVGETYDLRMNLSQMIQIAKSHDLLSAEGSKIYDYLDKLKHLRNKVHIHIASTYEESDFNSLTKYDYTWSGRALIYILKFLNNGDIDSVFNFLKNK